MRVAVRVEQVPTGESFALADGMRTRTGVDLETKARCRFDPADEARVGDRTDLVPEVRYELGRRTAPSVIPPGTG